MVLNILMNLSISSSHLVSVSALHHATTVGLPKVYFNNETESLLILDDVSQ